MLKNESTNVIIDFTKIDYIDSTGIGELVGYLGKFTNQNRKLILVNPSERIQKLLKLAKLDAVFKIYEHRGGGHRRGERHGSSTERSSRVADAPAECRVPLASVYRGSQLESFHPGSIAIVDSRGRLVAFAGDPATAPASAPRRSRFRPFPLLEYGGVEEYELTAEEIALTCASHGGEPVHVATAAALLRKGEFDEEDLLCGAHLPYDEKAAAELRASRRDALAAAQQLLRQARRDAARRRR